MANSQPLVGLPGARDYAQGVPSDASPLSRPAGHYPNGRFNEDFDAIRPVTAQTGLDIPAASIQRSNSNMSQTNTLTPSRTGTLKKRQSVKKSGSLRRSSSRRSLGAGSVKSLALGEREKYADGHGNEIYSAFFTPVPTTGNPTEVLANRFQAWRKVIKDLITYFRELQKSHESRSKSLLSASNILNHAAALPMFLSEGGIGDATAMLKNYDKQAIAEANKATQIEEDVILQLTGLRSDLAQKIKEIKNLSGDFKNSVDKETEMTRKAVQELQEALGLVDTAPGATIGKGDPFIVRLGVDRQVEKQIDEENYLHRAFLNLENSGRELESIVIGEIQKAYNAYTAVLKREADEAYELVETLRSGPIEMAKDREWNAFVHDNEHFVDPELPIRNAEQIVYPGKHAPAAMEVRAGMLERKSKYLKSYTPGWYVLSPTHLHEFKSPERINFQSPVMSLYLPEQKLGSHSNIDSSSHKFMLKGRQTGTLHRGHGWVFRAESQDTMLAWYEDMKNLTEKTGEERNAFVRKHARSVSTGSHRAGSFESDGAMDEDEADRVPYSATASQIGRPSATEAEKQKRPQPGGRFPSDLNVNGGLRVPMSPSSVSGSSDEHEVSMSVPSPFSSQPPVSHDGYPKRQDDQTYSVIVTGSQTANQTPVANHHQDRRSEILGRQVQSDLPFRYSSTPTEIAFVAEKHDGGAALTSQAVGNQNYGANRQAISAVDEMPPTPPQKPVQYTSRAFPGEHIRPDSNYGEWMSPVSPRTGGAATGPAEIQSHHQQQQIVLEQPPSPIPSSSEISSPQHRHDPVLPISPTHNTASAASDPSKIASTGAPSNSHHDEIPYPSNQASVKTPLTAIDTSKSSSLELPREPSPSGVNRSLETQPESSPPLPALTTVNTISDLHIPGEYPRRAAATAASP